MTVTTSHDPARLLQEQLAQASPDLLRELLTLFTNPLMSADADAVCGAAYGQASPDRVNRRNGYRGREFDTRAGTLDLAVPKLRTGTYFPEWLLERRKRAERALTSVVATCYLLGVSTLRIDTLVQSLGITSLSRSQVSEMARDLDDHVEQFRTRRLEEAGPFTFVAADALVLNVREDGAGWLGYFRDLLARGLSGVRLVTSDAHAGLVAAIGATIDGAAWQRSSVNMARGGLSAFIAFSSSSSTPTSQPQNRKRPACRYVVLPLPSLRFRLGCTLDGSPGIFGKSGG